MPQFTVKAPDGKEYKVNAPEGATHEDAVKHVQSTYYSSAPSNSGGSVLDKLKDSFLGGIVRGARDIPDGGAQLLTRGLEAIAPAGSDLEKFARSERKRVEKINNDAEKDYRQNWRGGVDQGIDGGRIAGNIGASLPLAWSAPIAQTSSPALIRALAGATSGAASAGMMPVNEKDQNNFWENKAAQSGIGALAGSMSPFVSDAIGKAISKYTNTARNTFSPASNQTIAHELQGELSSRGIDYSKLSKETQESLLSDAKKALSANGKLDFDALSRKADFESLGIKPTLGQVTRDPMQYQFEQNTRGVQGAGESLSQRFNEQNSQLIDALNKSRAGTNGAGSDKYSAARDVIEALQSADAAKKAGIDDLYATARNAAGINTTLNPANFAQSVNDALDYAMLGDALPAGVRKAINQVASGEMPFTIQKAEQIRQAINGQISGIPGRENAALKIVNNALQSAIDDNGSATGQVAADAFKAARGAAAQRFSDIDASAPLKAAIDGAEPDRFIQKYVTNGTAKDVMTLRSNLQNDPELWNEVRGQVIDYLKSEKALNGATDEFGKFSQSAYNKALKQIGDAKLKILFNPDELAQLKRVGRVASAIQSQPPGSAVNNSGTSQAISNLMSRMSGVPYLRELVINPMINFKVQGKVNSTLNPSQNAVINPSELDPKLIRALYLPLSVSGEPVTKQLLER